MGGGKDSERLYSSFVPVMLLILDGLVMLDKVT